ncbi:MAG: beta-ribofuranosylaminobenzene 5'-phosphate synthase family protein [Halobacteriales archaeon]|nr:beta-ribofuranosylaminobenzene 5'-phosphate synthase family protein [Halobacteriales archaeon]
MTRVSAGARIHIGFQNLSLAHDRLYGGVGFALDAPRVTIEASRADSVRCGDTLVAEYAAAACDLLDVSGVELTVTERLPRHVGLGSGTQIALATLSAVAETYDREPRVRERAPALGRGGRSGIGVATFERGGFVVDAGHPTTRFTTDTPEDGSWTVPPVVVRRDLPESWRVLLVYPDAESGRSGETEDASMRAAVERADPALADGLAGVLTRRLLPAVVAGECESFGQAVTAFDRRNGTWYTDAQGGVYRPPAGALIDELDASAALSGVGQSSWGPAVYGITDTSREQAARTAGEAALDAVGVSGSVETVALANAGARIE